MSPQQQVVNGPMTFNDLDSRSGVVGGTPLDKASSEVYTVVTSCTSHGAANTPAAARRWRYNLGVAYPLQDQGVREYSEGQSITLLGGDHPPTADKCVWHPRYQAMSSGIVWSLVILSAVGGGG